MVEKSSGMKLKTLRTDNGGEYASIEFADYLKKNGIQHQTTVPKTPEQNSIAERMNRTLVESVRSMLSDSKLPKRFWAEGLSTATYLHNRSPTNSVQGMTPYEVWTGQKPNVSQLRVFGCDAYPHTPKDERSKMDPKARKNIFLGYGNNVKGYRLYDKGKCKVFYSRDVIFNETKSGGDQQETKTNEEMQQETVEMECNDEISEARDADLQQPSIERKVPDRYGEWVYIATDVGDPTTINEALSRKDKEEWKRAMEKELTSLHKNEVWDLAQLPEGRKAVGSKWVFKTKHDAEGKHRTPQSKTGGSRIQSKVWHKL